MVGWLVDLEGDLVCVGWVCFGFVCWWCGAVWSVCMENGNYQVSVFV